MPSPITICLLIAAVLVAISTPIAGAVIAVFCAAIEFFLPDLAA